MVLFVIKICIHCNYHYFFNIHDIAVRVPIVLFMLCLVSDVR